MAATFGHIQEFRPDDESISAYLERLQLFFEANSVVEAKQVPVLLSVLGAKNYALLRSLLASALPKDKSYAELVWTLKRHFEPKPLIIAERFYFHRRNQNMGESVADYVAELRRLSIKCEFGDFLDEALRDRFVCGLRSETIQKRLLAEHDLTFVRAVEIAQGAEMADRNAKALKGTEVAVQKFFTPEKSIPPCHHCGRTNHEAKACRFREAQCHNCGRKGHIAPICRAKKALTRTRKFPRKPASPTTQWKESTSDSEELRLFTVGAKSSTPIAVELTVNGARITMEVDTGAAVSLISEQTLKAIAPNATLQPSRVILKTYTEERMSVLGELQVDVQYHQQSTTLPLVVVAGEGPSLFGRNWLESIRLNWHQICAISTSSASVGSLESLLEKHQEIFLDELGTIRSFPASLQVRPEARPKFFKARSVLFAIKDAIEQELDRLETSGILKKVTSSDWAAPIVAVPKKDGKFRICGDYKVTVNQALDVDQYPLPLPDYGGAPHHPLQ